MKKHLRASALFFLAFIVHASASAQENLAPDQNPNFAVSRDKYLRMSDSVTRWHSTTFQETYKAYDWYEAKMERKERREQFRRDLRMERARSRYYGHPGYQPYHRGYNRYYRPSTFWWF